MTQQRAQCSTLTMTTINLPHHSKAIAQAMWWRLDDKPTLPNFRGASAFRTAPFAIDFVDINASVIHRQAVAALY